MFRFPVSKPCLVGNERLYVNDCLDRVELSGIGPYVKKLEQKFARFCGTQHAVSCCNGTAALHLAYKAAGLKPGHNVVVPALTYVATANAATYCGANVIVIDVDPATWCMDINELERVLSSTQVQVIVPVHLYGVPANVEMITRLASKYGCKVVEDCAEAHGATIGTQFVGSLGHFGAFSFYGNKIFSCGEGGIVTTNSGVMTDLMVAWRGHCMSHEQRYHHYAVGYNYRLTNVQAAIALGQLESYGLFYEARRSIFSEYSIHLADLECQRTLIGESARWLYSVLLPHGVDRGVVERELAAVGIETRPIFVPLNELPMYLSEVELPVAADIARRGLSLPTYVGLKPNEVMEISTVLLDVIAKLRSRSQVTA